MSMRSLQVLVIIIKSRWQVCQPAPVTTLIGLYSVVHCLDKLLLIRSYNSGWQCIKFGC